METTPTRSLKSVAISAVLPAFNEEALIAASVQHVAAALVKHTSAFEIVVVNDGSRDRTGQVLAELQMHDPSLNLTVVTHDENRGYGAALASGFSAARGSLIFMTDGDEQFDVAELELLLGALDETTDMVIGWRHHRADPAIRRFNSWGWNLLVNLLFGTIARDVDCAFKLFRRRVWERISVQSRGATFSAELLIKTQRAGFHIKELPVSHLPRTAGQPTGARPGVIARAFVELVRLRWELLVISSPQPDAAGVQVPGPAA